MVFSDKQDMWNWEKFSTFLFFDKKLHRSESNEGSLKSRFKTLQAWFVDKDFTRENFTLLISHLSDKEYSNTTLNKIILTGKFLCEWQGLHTLDTVTYFRVGRKKVDYLLPEEVDALSKVKLPYGRLNEIYNFRDYVVIQLFYACALRIDEVAELKWSNVVEDAICYLVLEETKGQHLSNSSEPEEVPLPRRLYDLIQQLPHHGERVFDSQRGNKFCKPEFNRMLKRRAAAIGLEKPVYSHVFRHSKLSYLAQIMKYPLKTVSDFARHKRIETTSRYVHTRIEELYALSYASPLENKEGAWPELHKLALDYLKRLYGAASNNELLKAIQEMVEYQTGLKESLK